MKSREPRTTVLVPARMRAQTGWSDVVIQNVSAHGMMLKTAAPPRPGSYIEIRKASMVVVARAVWTGDQRFGVRTQDVIDIRTLLNQPIAANDSAPFGQGGIERRRSPRPEERAEAARRFGSRLQYAVFAAAIACAALTASLTVADVLVRPFAAINAALGARG